MCLISIHNVEISCLALGGCPIACISPFWEGAFPPYNSVFLGCQSLGRHLILWDCKKQPLCCSNSIKPLSQVPPQASSSISKLQASSIPSTSPSIKYHLPCYSKSYSVIKYHLPCYSKAYSNGMSWFPIFPPRRVVPGTTHFSSLSLHQLISLYLRILYFTLLTLM